MFKYYIDEQNKIHAFTLDGSQDSYITPNLAPITDEQAQAMLRPSTAALIASARARINAAYTIALSVITSGYPQHEIDSWPKQEAEARAWVAGTGVFTPWIEAAAAARGLEEGELVTRIIAKADAFARVHGQLTGKRQKLEDEIDMLGESPTQEQLDAIQW